MCAQRLNEVSKPGRRPALNKVRNALGRLEHGHPADERPIRSSDSLPESGQSLKALLEELLSIDEFNISGSASRDLDLKLAEAVRLSEVVTDSAFDLDLPEALDDAHRSLYALYADRTWRAPVKPRPEFADAALRTIRANLEVGFRHHLARRRAFAPLAAGESGQAAADRIMALALGPHPHDKQEWGRFVRDLASLEQLKEVVAQRSLFFLREPDPWIYAIPTLQGAAKAGLIDLLLDEYGWGKLERMHSNVYAAVMAALELPSETDHFETASSWQYIATLNHQWMCALTPEHSRRLLGTIYLTEATSPDAMTNYLAGWKRLGITDARVTEFYDLHVSADENHREVALEEVVMPVCNAEATALHEVALGIFDARTLEADFADHLVDSFTSGRTSLNARGSE